MTQKTLWAFFKERNISLEEISKKTGYSIRYLLNLMSGYDNLSDKARFRLLQAFPETASLFLSSSTGDSCESTGFTVEPIAVVNASTISDAETTAEPA